MAMDVCLINVCFIYALTVLNRITSSSGPESFLHYQDTVRSPKTLDLWPSANIGSTPTDTSIDLIFSQKQRSRHKFWNSYKHKYFEGPRAIIWIFTYCLVVTQIFTDRGEDLPLSLEQCWYFFCICSAKIIIFHCNLWRQAWLVAIKFHRSKLV